MRLPNTAHTSRPWRIHELTRDFRLEDVWALPTPGGPDDFPRLVQRMASGDPSQGSSRAVRTLFAIRWKVGELLGWDGPDAGLGSRVPTLRDRLPADLRDAPSGPDFDALPFTSLYLLDDEWAAEIANRTMHGVMHIGWVPDGTGGYRGQMAVLVKPNGLLGTAYMAAIRPFRHLIVYPPMMREIERAWRASLAIGPRRTRNVGAQNDTESRTERRPGRARNGRSVVQPDGSVRESRQRQIYLISRTLSVRHNDAPNVQWFATVARTDRHITRTLSRLLAVGDLRAVDGGATHPERAIWRVPDWHFGDGGSVACLSSAEENDVGVIMVTPGVPEIDA